MYQLGGQSISDFDPKQYWENRLRRNWGLLGVGHIGFGRYYNNWLYKVQRRIFLRHIRLLVDDWSKVNVLDIGSGTGYYIDLWKSLGVSSVTATDITTFAVEKLQKKFPNVNCFCLDIGNSLPEVFRNKRYDVISAFAVLYHIVNDDRYQRAFENISQMLRPGGFFVFSENFIHRETIRAQDQVCRSLNDIQTILKKTGFTEKVRVPIFALMNAPVDSKSTIIKSIWQLMMMPVRELQFMGFVLGALLYPFEMILTSCLKEGPSTELMICEKFR